MKRMRDLGMRIKMMNNERENCDENFHLLIWWDFMNCSNFISRILHSWDHLLFLLLFKEYIKDIFLYD